MSQQTRRAEGVGIAGISVYVPKRAVDQRCLEEFDNASPGKYTRGFGQQRMSLVGDREDINSICMTAVQQLVEDYSLGYDEIGRLEVATETTIDRSKSVKSCLMQLFEKSGNHEVEGLDSINACFGGTQAFFNTVAWMESSMWDGRYGVVVAGDIAIYAPGPARPTGGCGAVALLIGPGAPIRPEPGLRATWIENTWDFCKPVSTPSEYPTLNGKETIRCYNRGFEKCLNLFVDRYEAKLDHSFDIVRSFDFFAAHAPYRRLIQKVVARMMHFAFRRSPPDPSFSSVPASVSPEHCHTLDKDLERVFVEASEDLYLSKCEPWAWFGAQTGNSYTASLFSSLAALIETKGDQLAGSRILMYSFGSGFAASLYSLHVVGSVGSWAPLMQLQRRLENRVVVSPQEYVRVLARREFIYSHQDAWIPEDDVSSLWPGTFYLTGIAHNGERAYDRIPR